MPFDHSVPEKDEHGRKFIKVRNIRNSTFAQAANSFFTADEKGKVVAVFDHEILKHTDKWREETKEVVLHQVMEYAVGAHPSKYTRYAWHEIDARIALRVMRNIFQTRLGNSQIKKACAGNIGRRENLEWDIRTHPESVPVNGPSGKASDGIHKVTGFDDLK